MNDPGDARPVRSSISAIIPCFNYGEFVEDAIESALAQTLPFCEIIVVNDGSTDNSLEIIRRYEGRVEIIDQPNTGQMAAARAGICVARGAYIYILDADDYLMPHMVATIEPLLSTRPAKIQFQLFGVDREKRPMGSIYPLFPRRYHSADMVEDNRIAGFHISPPTSGIIYRRDVVNDARLGELDQKDAFDGVPNLITPYQGAVVSLNRAMAYRRTHDANLSGWSKPSVERLRSEIALFKRRWEQAVFLLNQPERQDLARTVYVAERELMIAALEGADRVPEKSAAFLRSLVRTRFPLLMKAALATWAVLLAVAPREAKRKLVMWRRSPRARPDWFNRSVLQAKRLLDRR